MNVIKSWAFGTEERKEFEAEDEPTVMSDSQEESSQVQTESMSDSEFERMEEMEYDEGQTRDIDELLIANKERIKRLREATQEVLSPEHDDIWLLRYVLSNKEDEKAEKKVRFTIEYRKKNRSWLSRAAQGEEGAPHRDIVKKYCNSSLHKRKVDGGPVLILRR